MKHEIFLHNNQTYSIFIGGNKCENTALIADSSSNDVWFHIAGLPSCHVIMKNMGKLGDIPRQVIKRCAYLCKINTNIAKSMPKCNVIYTTVANVQTTAIAGTVITQNTKTISV
jgi:predicted ribosome quality control (RQC) complex YloA/Tae2 family protein